jgi:hypothetical protein
MPPRCPDHRRLDPLKGARKIVCVTGACGRGRGRPPRVRMAALRARARRGGHGFAGFSRLPAPRGRRASFKSVKNCALFRARGALRRRPRMGGRGRAPRRDGTGVGGPRGGRQARPPLGRRVAPRAGGGAAPAGRPAPRRAAPRGPPPPQAAAAGAQWGGRAGGGTPAAAARSVWGTPGRAHAARARVRVRRACAGGWRRAGRALTCWPPARR